MNNSNRSSSLQTTTTTTTTAAATTTIDSSTSCTMILNDQILHHFHTHQVTCSKRGEDVTYEVVNRTRLILDCLSRDGNPHHQHYDDAASSNIANTCTPNHNNNNKEEEEDMIIHSTMVHILQRTLLHNTSSSNVVECTLALLAHVVLTLSFHSNNNHNVTPTGGNPSNSVILLSILPTLTELCNGSVDVTIRERCVMFLGYLAQYMSNHQANQSDDNEEEEMEEILWRKIVQLLYHRVEDKAQCVRLQALLSLTHISSPNRNHENKKENTVSSWKLLEDVAEEVKCRMQYDTSHKIRQMAIPALLHLYTLLQQHPISSSSSSKLQQSKMNAILTRLRDERSEVRIAVGTALKSIPYDALSHVQIKNVIAWGLFNRCNETSNSILTMIQCSWLKHHKYNILSFLHTVPYEFVTRITRVLLQSLTESNHNNKSNTSSSVTMSVAEYHSMRTNALTSTLSYNTISSESDTGGITNMNMRELYNQIILHLIRCEVLGISQADIPDVPTLCILLRTLMQYYHNNNKVVDNDDRMIILVDDVIRAVLQLLYQSYTYSAEHGATLAYTQALKDTLHQMFSFSNGDDVITSNISEDVLSEVYIYILGGYLTPHTNNHNDDDDATKRSMLVEGIEGGTVMVNQVIRALHSRLMHVTSTSSSEDDIDELCCAEDVILQLLSLYRAIYTPSGTIHTNVTTTSSTSSSHLQEADEVDVLSFLQSTLRLPSSHIQECSIEVLTLYAMHIHRTAANVSTAATSDSDIIIKEEIHRTLIQMLLHYENNATKSMNNSVHRMLLCSLCDLYTSRTYLDHHGSSVSVPCIMLQYLQDTMLRYNSHMDNYGDNNVEEWLYRTLLHIIVKLYSAEVLNDEGFLFSMVLRQYCEGTISNAIRRTSISDDDVKDLLEEQLCTMFLTSMFARTSPRKDEGGTNSNENASRMSTLILQCVPHLFNTTLKEDQHQNRDEDEEMHLLVKICDFLLIQCSLVCCEEDIRTLSTTLYKYISLYLKEREQKQSSAGTRRVTRRKRNALEEFVATHVLLRDIYHQNDVVSIDQKSMKESQENTIDEEKESNCATSDDEEYAD